MTAVVVVPLRRSHPALDWARCAEPDCRFNDPDGALAREGRLGDRAAVTHAADWLPVEAGGWKARPKHCGAPGAAPMAVAFLAVGPRACVAAFRPGRCR